MTVTVLIIISTSLILGIIYTIVSINFAEVDEGQIEETFNKDGFSKPPGWKVGKMPPEMKRPALAERQDKKPIKKTKPVENLFSSFQLENNLPLSKENMFNQNKV